jgi:formate/nitrite transporter
MAVQAFAPGLHAVMTAAIFPIGLSMIVLSGTNLFTGEMMFGWLPFMSKDPRRTSEQKIANWTKLCAVVFAGNLVGALGMAYSASYLFVGGETMATFAKALAVKKTSMSFGMTFLKGIGANWCACLAIYQAKLANSPATKIGALWLPTMTFVTLGMEHSVANMFFVPFGMLCGADVTIPMYLYNSMLPAVLGNLVGGAGFVGTLQWLAVMPKPKNKDS